MQAFSPDPSSPTWWLADEINRATPKTQSALLEAMQERTVTSGTVTHELERPFLVMATQNPIEMEGTYPLPEAQLDRFLMKILVKYPSPRRGFSRIVERTIQKEDGSAHPRDGSRLHPRSALGLPRSSAGAARAGIRRLALRSWPPSRSAEGGAPARLKKYVRYGSSPRGALGAGGMPGTSAEALDARAFPSHL